MGSVGSGLRSLGPEAVLGVGGRGIVGGLRGWEMLVAFDDDAQDEAGGIALVEIDGVKLQVQSVDEDGLRSVGLGDRLDLEAALADVAKIASKVTGALEAVAPSKIGVEFGVGFEVEAGKLTSWVVDSKGSCTLTVKLEWDRTKE